MIRPTRTHNLLLGLIATILAGWVLHTGATIIQPIVIALLLAIMLQPVVVLLSRFGIPPAATVLVLTVLLFMGLVQLGLLLQANVVGFLGKDSVSPAIEAAQATLEAGQRSVGGWQKIQMHLSNRMGEWNLPSPVRAYLQNAIEEVNLSGLAQGLALSSFGFMKGLVLVLIYMVFIFAEQAIFRRKILAIAGDRREEAAEILSTIGRGIQKYLGVKTIISFLTGALCYSVLQALDIPYSLLFGLLTFLLNYIPTFGSIIAGLFPTVTALTLDDSITKVPIVVATYLAVNLTLGSFIEPRILGRELNLSPLVVVISVVVWAGLWGVVGGFLAVPLTAALQITLASNDSTRPIAVMLGSGPPRKPGRMRKILPSLGADPEE
ncbi:MAG: AI-2E family transporter [Planctomycetes bacterium]|nr:AI-2E family transporter [Planctomycetota bacterium]MCB9909114.1 AI-2E family transporter [Planctomycetota bacterium]MCB9911636.1 AI-2E family transporter [Planctomycetota bacterium]